MIIFICLGSKPFTTVNAAIRLYLQTTILMYFHIVLLPESFAADLAFIDLF
jgi:hypothetical protein